MDEMEKTSTLLAFIGQVQTATMRCSVAQFGVCDYTKAQLEAEGVTSAQAQAMIDMRDDVKTFYNDHFVSS